MKIQCPNCKAYKIRKLSGIALKIEFMVFIVGFLLWLIIHSFGLMVMGAALILIAVTLTGRNKPGIDKYLCDNCGINYPYDRDIEE